MAFEGTLQEITLRMHGDTMDDQWVEAQQGDTASRKVRIHLKTFKGADFLIPYGAVAVLSVDKTDGHKVLNACEIEDSSTVIMTLTSQVLACKGMQLSQIYICTEEGDIKSQKFFVHVPKAVYDDDTVESTDEYGILHDLIARVEALKDGVTYTPHVSEDGELSWTNDGGLDNPEAVNIKGLPGKDGKDGKDGDPGKTAYEYAKEGGYPGTQEEFAAKLAAEVPRVDDALSEESVNAVQNKVVSKEFAELNSNYTQLKSDLAKKVDEADLETEVANQLDGSKADIVAELIAQIGGIPVFGTVDDNNAITVTSTLADGEYILYYENDEGVLEKIGAFVIGDGEITSYTNVLDEVGYTTGYRINSAGEEVAQDGMCVTGYIPITYGTLRAKNITIDGTKTGYVVTYNANKEMITCHATAKLVDDGTGTYEFAVTESTCAFVRLSIGTIDDTTIVTVNEEITEVTPTYTNLAKPTSEDWLSNTRLSSSGTSEAEGLTTTNMISATSADIVRVKGMTFTGYTSSLRVHLINNGSIVNGTFYASDVYTIDTDGIVVFDLSKWSSTTFNAIRLCGYVNGTDEDVIITVNEEI